MNCSTCFHALAKSLVEICSLLYSWYAPKDTMYIFFFQFWTIGLYILGYIMSNKVQKLWNFLEASSALPITKTFNWFESTSRLNWVYNNPTITRRIHWGFGLRVKVDKSPIIHHPILLLQFHFCSNLIPWWWERNIEKLSKQ